MLIVCPLSALAVTLALPIASQPAPRMAAISILLAVVLAVGARVEARRFVAACATTVLLTLLLRLPMISLYVSGAELPASLPWLFVAPSAASWSEGSLLMVQGADGLVAMSTEASKWRLWLHASVVLAAVVALTVGRRTERAPWFSIGKCLLLWVLAFALRFAVLTEWFAATPEVMVSRRTAALGMFWSTSVDAGLVVACAAAIAWAAAPTADGVDA